METTISAVARKLKENWDFAEEKKASVEEKAGEALSGGPGKLKEEKVKVVDIVVKAAQGEKKNTKGVARPVFLAGMLLDEKNPAYFKVTAQDIYGGGGKIALWIRHFLLTHLRDNVLEDKFLRSLASAGKEGVEAVWKDVLAGLGVPPEARQGMIGKLVDETSWVALTLVKEKVREKVLEELDAAKGVACKLRDDKVFIAAFAEKLLHLKGDEARKAVLSAAGFKKSDAGDICGLIASKGKSAAGEIKGMLKEHAAAVARKLNDIMDEVRAMDLGKYNALLDFKPELEGVMKGLGQVKAKGDFLSSLVADAQKDAKIGRIAHKTAEILIETSAFVGFTIITGGVVTPGTPLLYEIMWQAGEAVIHGTQLSLSIRSDSFDARLLEQLGIGGK
jgi:hypothetical protein